ncbi:hypothetical protein ACQ4PT_041826 [Festuca glaucescens]
MGSIQREQKRNRGCAQSKNGCIASSLATRNSPPCRPDVYFLDGKKMRYLGPDLPEDIWRHIHFLLPMQDAARLGCVSHSFLQSWRCYPNLTFTNKTMCSKENLRNGTVGWNVIRDYTHKIDCVLANHSGAGVRKFKLEYYAPCDAVSCHQLNSWLKMAVTPGIEELDFTLFSKEAPFDFPCKLLSDQSQHSIQHLRLLNCGLHPTFQLGLRSLKMLQMCTVRITDDELGCLLSNSFALEHLQLLHCDDIIHLEIPSLLQRLKFLEVFECSNLHVIENKAPNISRFRFGGYEVQLSLGESLKVKNMMLHHSCAISYAVENLPSCVPNLLSLTIYSSCEKIDVPVVSSKFLHLKFLSILIFGGYFNRDYDYLSLVSYFDAAPSLEKFVLYVKRQSKYESFQGDTSSLRRMPDHCHKKLKSVEITGFCPQKSMVELTCHILKNVRSLKSLTLDPSPVNNRCSGNILDKGCPPLETAYIREAHRTILAIRTYIEGEVPPTVTLSVLEPCARCHAL